MDPDPVPVPAYHFDADPGPNFYSKRMRIRIHDTSSFPLFLKHINYLCTYDLYSPVHNVLDACISITRGSGRGLGPGILEFFGLCEMVTSR